MAASASSEATDGPVLSLMNKRLRSLRKKYNRIVQLEEGISQGKPIKKEQEDILRSKPAILTLIDEYEKLRQPLSVAVEEELELTLALHRHPVSATETPKETEVKEEEVAEAENNGHDPEEAVVEDLLNILYFGCLFDVKPQSDFTSTMLTRTHERGCCLTYDYVTDEATDLLGERDLDLISMLGGLVISRPVHSSLSHKNALRSCVQHAKLWLSNSDQPIEPEATVTYAGLRQRLNKILASDYFTTTPEMKAPVEMAAAAGKYVPCQVPVHNYTIPSSVPAQAEVANAHYQQKDEEIANFQGQETDADQYSPVEELPKDELGAPNNAEVISVQQEQHRPDAEVEQNQGNVESNEQQYIPRKNYQSQRGGSRGGGRRAYANGRGGRSSRGGGFQTGRNQYYDQPGNYYPRHYYNPRGRSSSGAGGYPYSNHVSGAQGSHAQADAECGNYSRPLSFVEYGKKMVMDFTATWCGPCRSMDSVIDELATKFTDVVFVKIDVDKLMEIAQVYEVQTMPTFLLIKQGKVVDAVVGAKKDELHRKIEQHTIQLAY
ncbi:hypothetical protein HHK36_024810 [Tetracentron sinense]|uniref:Thioredoxin domain-containing protein n=1 Tax=Tetracentron sinense TaxID=13715 RepID=A0A834YNS0_TETSI|nr:hypothetical protein HHK36_024810 [Tetracentron sinense]